MLAKIKQFVKLGSRTLTRSAFSGTNLSKALSKFHYLVKLHQSDIILVIGVILISLFSFAMGYIIAKQQQKEPIQIERYDTNIRMNANTANMRIFVYSYHPH